MDNLFIIAGIVSVIFFISKFLEMRFVEDEPKPLKIIIRDSLLVYCSVLMGGFIIEQLTPAIAETNKKTIPNVFIDNPPF